MSKIYRSAKLALLTLLGAVLLLAAGCAGAGSQAQPQVVYPTVVIVQYVTQVVATITPAPPVTPAPPATAKPAVSSGVVGYDPASQDIYYPLMGCQVASRLHVGERAFVANGGGQIGLHYTKDIGDAPIYRKLAAGEELDVIGGPFCERQSLVWKVIASDGQEGFAPEGNGNTYWLMPTGDLVDKKKLKATPDQGLRLGLPNWCKSR